MYRICSSRWRKTRPKNSKMNSSVTETSTCRCSSTVCGCLQGLCCSLFGAVSCSSLTQYWANFKDCCPCISLMVQVEKYQFIKNTLLALNFILATVMNHQTHQNSVCFSSGTEVGSRFTWMMMPLLLYSA